MTFGVMLKSCSVEDIKQAVRATAGLPVAELKGMARRAWESARKHHTRERWAEEYRNAIMTIMELRSKERTCESNG